MTHNSDAVKQADISVDAGSPAGVMARLDVSGHVGRLRGGIARLPHAVGGDAAARPQSRRKLGCDVNAVVSCSTVAESWQAEFIKFAGLSFPNAFFGIAAESVFVTIAVIGLSKVVVPRWFALCTWLGGLALGVRLLAVHPIDVRDPRLCPWCLGLMFATTIQFMALSHATVSVQRMPASTACASTTG